MTQDTGILGGPEKRKIIIVPYQDDWPTRFASEAQRIRDTLGPMVLGLEHIGSTSVPGLAAKPIVDILLILADPSDEESYLPPLLELGLELRVREPDFDQHRMLRTRTHDLHLHVYPDGSKEITRYILFRNALRSDPAIRDDYVALKRRLAAQDWDDMNNYADAKGPFIEEVIARARAQTPS